MSADPSLRNELITAVFVDFENLALGVEQDKKGRFEIELVLKRLLESGRIVFKRAYCDWTRFKDFMHEFHRHGFEMVDIPSSKVSGKNSADIRMVVDAIDLCYSKSHIDTFALRDRRQRLLAARLEAQGERQARHRLRRAQLDVGPARQQLRRVHLLRRPDPRAEAHADAPQTAGSRRRRAPDKPSTTPTSASRRRSTGSSRRLPRSRRTTTPSGARS